MLWVEDNLDNLDIITRSFLVPVTVVRIAGYIPRFYTQKGTGSRIEYFQLYIRHIYSIQEIKSNINIWMQEHGIDIYVNILQVERLR